MSPCHCVTKLSGIQAMAVGIRRRTITLQVEVMAAWGRLHSEPWVAQPLVRHVSSSKSLLLCIELPVLYHLKSVLVS